MKNSRLALMALASLTMGLGTSALPPEVTEKYSHYNLKNRRAYAKPKRNVANTLRGYCKVHVLSEYIAEKNLAKAANGNSGFKGFRKIRAFSSYLGGTYWSPVA
jgi:hypothetical protein